VPVENVTDSFYAAQLLERVRWAVEDAAVKERDGLVPAREADDDRDQNVVSLFVAGSSSPAAADAPAASQTI
jgi:predicted regulator of Ras-like GTPase activity (Roadblock/LC7/MglB family)